MEAMEAMAAMQINQTAMEMGGSYTKRSNSDGDERQLQEIIEQRLKRAAATLNNQIAMETSCSYAK